MGYLDYFRAYLRDIATHFFKWSGDLPERVTSAFLEKMLIDTGYMVAYEYDGLKITQGALSGLDWTLRPKVFTSSNPYIKPPQVRSLIGDKPGAVVCYNTGDPYHIHGTADTIDIFAQRLAHVALSMDTSVINSRVAAIFNAESEAEARQIMVAYGQVIEGKPLVINLGNSELFGEKQRIFPIKARDNLITPELRDTYNGIMAEFYDHFGVKSLAVDKKERVTVGENESKTEQASLQKSIYLKAREDFCEQVREYLGYDIHVEMNIGGGEEAPRDPGEEEEDEQRETEVADDNSGI